jgi:hypothetical protein
MERTKSSQICSSADWILIPYTYTASMPSALRPLLASKRCVARLCCCWSSRGMIALLEHAPEEIPVPVSLAAIMTFRSSTSYIYVMIESSS